VLGVAADTVLRGLLAAAARCVGCRLGGDLVPENAQRGPVGCLGRLGVRPGSAFLPGFQGSQEMAVDGRGVAAWGGTAPFPGADGVLAHAAGVGDLVQGQSGLAAQSAPLRWQGQAAGRLPGL
jgi:hypothetical protein